jgi:aminopeptidase YwaD
MLELHQELTYHLHRLAGEIGPRPSGSPGNQAAAAYIESALRAAGCATETQAYACPDWRCAGASLVFEGHELAVEANAFSPSCDTTAPVVALGTLPELEASEISGKTALFYGDLAQAPLSAKSWFLKTERDEQIFQLLDKKKPAALLTVRPATAYLSQGTEDWELALPAATLPAESALRLLRSLNPVAHLRLTTSQAQGQTANVLGRLPGRRPERIVVSAHYDTKINTPGAQDNAGGVSILLALARHLKTASLKCGLEFVAFAGEEYLPIGDETYWRTAQADQMLAVINLDGAGAYLGANSLTAMACSAALEAMARDTLKAYPGAVWVAPWPESNHSLFAWRGVPALAMSSVGNQGLAHSPDDAEAQVSPAKLNEAASIAADLLLSLEDRALDWGRDKPA